MGPSYIVGHFLGNRLPGLRRVRLRPCTPWQTPHNKAMNPLGRRIHFCQIALLTALSGCASSSPVAARYSVRTSLTGELDGAWEAAAATLNALGYQIDDREHRGGVFTAEFIEKKTDSSSIRARSRPPVLVRHRVELRVKPLSAGVKMFCKVDIQHQTTEAHRLLAFDRTGSDMPGRTPIDRDAATTIEQNTVWATIRRDKVAERAILTAILDRLPPAPQERPEAD